MQRRLVGVTVSKLPEQVQTAAPKGKCGCMSYSLRCLQKIAQCFGWSSTVHSSWKGLHQSLEDTLRSVSRPANTSVRCKGASMTTSRCAQHRR